MSLANYWCIRYSFKVSHPIAIFQQIESMLPEIARESKGAIGMPGALIYTRDVLLETITTRNNEFNFNNYLGVFTSNSIYFASWNQVHKAVKSKELEGLNVHVDPFLMAFVNGLVWYLDFGL